MDLCLASIDADHCNDFISVEELALFASDNNRKTKTRCRSDAMKITRVCFDAGIPESDIKDWVGHSDSKIVKLYRHIRSETAKVNMGLGKFGAV